MAGLFDDLLPEADIGGGGLFDDLLPSQKPKKAAEAPTRGVVGEFVTGIPRGALQSTGAGIEGTAQAAESGARKLGLEVSPEPGMVERAGAGIRKFGQEQFPKGTTNEVAGNIGEAIGSTGPLIGTALIPGVGLPLTVMMGVAQGSSEAVERARQAGATQEQIDTAALLGTIPGGSEFIPIELMLTRVPQSARKPLRDWAISTVRAFGLEGTQEATQAILQDAIERYVHSPNKEIGEDFIEQGLYGGTAGGAINALLYPFLRRSRTQAERERVAPGELPLPDSGTTITEPTGAPSTAPTPVRVETGPRREDMPLPPWGDPALTPAGMPEPSTSDPLAHNEAYSADERIPWGPGKRETFEDKNVTKAELDYENFLNERKQEPLALPPSEQAEFETEIGTLNNRQAEEFIANNQHIPGVTDIMGQISVPYRQRMDSALANIFRAKNANLQLPSTHKGKPIEGNLGKRFRNKRTGLMMGGAYPKAEATVPLEKGGLREDAQAMTGEQRRDQVQKARSFVESLKPGASVDLLKFGSDVGVRDTSTQYELLRQMQKEGLVRRAGGDKRWVAKPKQVPNVQKSVSGNTIGNVEIMPSAKLTPAQEQKLVSFVERLGGKSIKGTVFDTSGNLAKQAGVDQGTTLGFYDPINQLIKIANNKGYANAQNTAAHEPFHHVQNFLLTPQERRMLLDDMDTFFQIADDVKPGWATNYNASEQVREAQAIVAADYAQRRENGQPTDPRLKLPQRGVLEKILRFFRRLSTWLQGNGYLNPPETSVEILEDYSAGRLGRREVQELTERTQQDIMRSTAAARDDNITARRELETLTLYDRWIRNVKDIADKYPALRPFERALNKVYEYRQQMLQDNAKDFQDFAALSQAEQENATKWLVDMDRKQLPKKEVDSYISTAAPQVQKAIKSVRRGLDRIWDENIRAFKKSLGLNETISAQEIRDLSKTEPGKENFYKNVADVVEEMNSRADTSYLPHVRLGDHHVVVHDMQDVDAQGNPKQVWFQTVDASPVPFLGKSQTSRELQRVARSLRGGLFKDSGRYKITTGQNTFDFFTQQLVDAPGVINTFMNVVGSRKLKDADGSVKGLNDLFKEIQDRLTHQTFRRRLTKEREGVPGWIHKDNEKFYLRQALTSYSLKSAHFISRMRHRDEINKSMEKIESPDLINFASDVNGYTQSGEEEFQFLKAMGFHWMLGFNLSSALVNSFQTFQATLPYTLAFTNNPVKATRLIGRAMKDAAALSSGFSWRDGFIDLTTKPKGLTVEEWEGIKIERARGALLPSQMHELSGLSLTGLRGVPGLSKYMNNRGTINTLAAAGEVSSLLFNYVEQVNRITAYLVGHRLASNPQTKKDLARGWRGSRWEDHQIDPHMAGRAFVEDTQGIFSKETRPRLLRGVGGVALQFTNYQFFMLNQWLKAAFQYGGGVTKSPEARRMLASYVLFTFITAGLLGLPLMYPAKEGLEMMFRGITERRVDLDYSIRTLLAELGSPGWFIESLMKGPFRMTGIDVSRRTAMEIIPTDLLKGGGDFGPSSQIFIGNVGEAIGHFNRGETILGTAALMPLAAKNIVEGARQLQTDEVRTRSDRVLPVDIGVGEPLLKIGGFTGSSVARAREKLQVEKHLQTRLNELRDSYYDRLAKHRLFMMDATKENDSARYKRNYEKFQSVLREAIEYDKGKPLSERLRLDMKNVTKRIKADIMAKRGQANIKKLSPANRAEGLALDDLYGG